MNYENLKEFNFKNVFMTSVNSKRLSLSVRGNHEKSHKCAPAKRHKANRFKPKTRTARIKAEKLWV